MPQSRAAGLRQVADNLDTLADQAADAGRSRRAHALRNNATFLRKTAALEHAQETAMGKFADKIHAVEKERDDAKAEGRGPARSSARPARRRRRSTRSPPPTRSRMTPTSPR